MKRKIAQAFITAALISSMAVSPVFATPSVEDLQNDKAAAEDEVVSLQSELTGILDKISTLESDLQKKQEELKNAQIKSSIDGTVVRVNSKVGQFADKVEDDKPMFSIENLEQLELEIKVSEYSIGKVQVGQKAVITADILDGASVEGKVVKISPTGEEKGGGSTERVIPTTIRIDGDKSRLIAGITAKAELLIREAKDTFCVPVTAVFDRGDGPCIAVAENMRVRIIPVTLGVDGDVEVEVIPREGDVLTEGMQVITNPEPQTEDGTAVTIAAGGV